MAKHISNFNSFIKENNNLIPVGTKVEMTMGVGGKGTVIPWFNWRDATDGTYSSPNKYNYVAIDWDNGEKGFAPIAYLRILNDDGSKEELGRLIKDEEYDTTGDKYEIILNKLIGDAGYIEFEDGSVDNFFVYNNGKIAFNNWYPKDKSKKLTDEINKKIKTKKLTDEINQKYK